jgi:hypothetical protein
VRTLVSRRQTRAWVALLGVAAAAALVISLSGLVGQTPNPSGSAEASLEAQASFGSPEPVAQWTALDLPPDASIAELISVSKTARDIPTTATFQLRSLGKITPRQLAAGLRVDPPIKFSVKPGSGADRVVIRPSAPLAQGTLYRFRLLATDGSLAGSWAFQTASPLHVVDRLPDDRTTGVPLDTGIEVGFDQDSPIGISSHFSIQPTVTGRFEAHGRTWVFVPAKPLTPATLYTVIVRHGVGLSGSTEILESDVRWQFETTATGTSPAAEVRVSFERPVVELRPGKPVELYLSLLDQLDHPPTSLPLEIYRMPSATAARSAATVLLADTGWTTWSQAGLVDTTGLTRIASVQATVESPTGASASVIHLALPLDPGWYLAVVPRKARNAQALIQVTDLAAYALSTETRTVAWLNDLGTLGPVSGVRLTLPSGATLGPSDSTGLIEVTTPAELLGTASPADSYKARVLVATDPTGRQLLVPLGMNSGPVYPGEDHGAISADDPSATWWMLLATDRTQYRTSDTIHAWGLVRARSDRSVPGNLELRLRPSSGNAGAPILRVPTTASARGVFTTNLRYADLPVGNYDVDLFAGTARVATTSISVGVIRKPAFQLNVATNRHAYIAGDSIAVSASAVFYDGTAAPGMDLRISAFEKASTGTTDPTGQFATTIPASVEQPEGYQWASVDIAPATPEEGLITGSAPFYVFPSTAWLDAIGKVSAGRVVLTGRVSQVDLARVDREVANGVWSGDPSGSALAGRTIGAQVIHIIPVRTQVGTTYDFVLKRVVPLYQYSSREETIARLSVTSASDGRFALSSAAPVPADSYRVVLTAQDAAGRTIRLETFAAQAAEQPTSSPRPYLDQFNPCGYYTSHVTHLNAPVDLSVHEADGRIAADGDYLFIVGKQGLDGAVLQRSSTFSRVFRDADLPNILVRGIRFSAAGYEVTNTLEVQVDVNDKTLAVTLTPNRARYAPGDTVTVDVSTRDAAGRAIAADVVVRGVDEKLYTIGGAGDIDALSSLLSPVGLGFLQSFTSHPVAANPLEGGCGDTGGGRDDFRDSVTFQRIATDASGHGTVSFDLPDDLTSWHISATALSGRFDAGSAAVLVPVGLPFFVDAVVAPDYLAGDRMVLRVRAFGDALRAGDPVHFTVEAPTLGLSAVEIDGTAFEAVRFSLPALTLGDHRVTTRAVAHGTSLADSVVRIVHVIPSRLGRLDSRRDPLGTGFSAQGGDGLTTYVITDAGRGALLSVLHDLASSSGARFDASLAADLAGEMLVKEFGVSSQQLPPSSFDASRYENYGITLLPYASADLFMSARAALVAPERLDTAMLRAALEGWRDDSKATRERRIVALAGLAGLGDDVLAALRNADDGSLTIREQLWLGLGLLASGDEPAARSIERAVLLAHGQRLGPWVRLATGSTLEDSLAASGLLLQLAGGLGDPLAAGVSAYLTSQQSHETLFSLEQVAYARASLARLPRVAARFAWTLGGQRHEVALEPGGSFSLVLTANQRADLKLEPLSGQLVVSSSWLAAATAADLPADPAITISRSVSPAASASESALVYIRLNVSFGASAPKGCYQVTDLLPSGLAPLAAVDDWQSQDAPVGTRILMPYEVDGQRVSWCVDPTDGSSFILGYAARVVSPGTYRWEPAVAQFGTAPTLGAATGEESYTIR